MSTDTMPASPCPETSAAGPDLAAHRLAVATLDRCWWERHQANISADMVNLPVHSDAWRYFYDMWLAAQTPYLDACAEEHRAYAATLV